ncbi:hypothetical protein EDM00_11595 [Ornithobacterium rhinotracheale]|nr:hypothetical protein [Ornithobacterium rhinotracheale]
MQSYSYLTKQKIASEKAWEILALEKDRTILREKGFITRRTTDYINRHRNPMGIISRTMTFNEVQEFLENLSLFNIHNMGTAGKIYDLKHKPLNDEYAKQEYKTILPAPCIEA